MPWIWDRTRPNTRALVACLIGAALGLQAGQADAQGSPPAAVLHYPDIVLVKGKVVGSDDRFSIREAVAIREERILAAGTSAEVRALAGPHTRIIHLKGRTVLPASSIHTSTRSGPPSGGPRRCGWMRRHSWRGSWAPSVTAPRR